MRWCSMAQVFLYSTTTRRKQKTTDLYWKLLLNPSSNPNDDYLETLIHNLNNGC
jgi:hypothetical protein